MGWTFFADMPGLTPAQILIKEASGTGENGRTWSVLDHATKGNVFYAVIEYKHPGHDPFIYGEIFLFKRSKKTGEFGFKNISETCGPYQDKCPVRLIDMLDKLAPIDPANNSQSAQWARDWRARCRANAKRKPAPAVKPGDIVKFAANGPTYELICKAGPRRGWLVKLKNEAVPYRATARQIANCQIVEA